eukprot:2464000-Rhodomonas_salina.4
MGSKIADLMPGQPGTGGKDEEEKNAEEGDMEYWNLDQLAPGTRKYKQKVQENKKQLDFVKRLRGLQEAMEFAHFAKPVCDQCKEAVKEYDNDRMNNTLAASQEKASTCASRAALARVQCLVSAVRQWTDRCRLSSLWRAEKDQERQGQRCASVQTPDPKDLKLGFLGYARP